MAMRILAAAAAAVGLSLSPGGRASQADYCDSRLKFTRGEVYGYFARPGRCEGLYDDQSSGEAFLILGYVVGDRTFAPGAARFVPLSWDATTTIGDSVRIVGMPLGDPRPYRMDTRIATAAGRFLWPTDVLNGLAMDGADVGLRAWVTTGRAGRRDSVMVPLVVGNPKLRRDARPRLVIRSVADIREVHLTVRHPATGHEVAGPFTRRIRPDEGPTFEVVLPEGLPGGRFVVEVGAEVGDGLPATDHAVVLIPHRGGRR